MIRRTSSDPIDLPLLLLENPPPMILMLSVSGDGDDLDKWWRYSALAVGDLVGKKEIARWRRSCCMRRARWPYARSRRSGGDLADLGFTVAC